MDIIVILIILLIILSLLGSRSAYTEGFNARDNIVMPISYPDYGLRGERLRTRALYDCYYDHYNCYENSYTPFFPAYAVDGCNCGFFPVR